MCGTSKKNEPRNNKRATEQLKWSTCTLLCEAWTWFIPTSVPSDGVRLSFCGGRVNARGTGRNAAAHLRLSRSIRPASSLPPRLSLGFLYGDLLLVLCPALRKCSTPRSAGVKGWGGGGCSGTSSDLLTQSLSFFCLFGVSVIFSRRSLLWSFVFSYHILAKNKKDQWCKTSYVEKKITPKKLKTIRSISGMKIPETLEVSTCTGAASTCTCK